MCTLFILGDFAEIFKDSFYAVFKNRNHSFRINNMEMRTLIMIFFLAITEEICISSYLVTLIKTVFIRIKLYIFSIVDRKSLWCITFFIIFGILANKKTENFHFFISYLLDKK